MKPAAAGAKGVSSFCFFAVCFLIFSFTAVLVFLLLEQDDGPSVPRRTRPAADEAHGGRGPRQMRPAAAGAKGMSPFCFFAVFFLVFSFTAVLVLLLLEQDDRPSDQRQTRPAPDEGHGRRSRRAASSRTAPPPRRASVTGRRRASARQT